MQVDVTTRMGALSPATPTGFPTLDRALNGGLRSGSLLSLTGGSGTGKTALALLLAYMAARGRAGVVFTSVALDPTEIMARLAARALLREHPELGVHYGAIWSGQAFQDELTRAPVTAAIDTVVKKVGAHLHLHAARPFESTTQLTACAAHLWGRHERVVLIVDGLEAFRASGGSDAAEATLVNQGFESRVSQVAWELRQLAEQGCAVVITGQPRVADLIAPAATLAAELRLLDTPPQAASDRAVWLGARPVELLLTKNRLGTTGLVPLRFMPGAAVFEERTP